MPITGIARKTVWLPLHSTPRGAITCALRIVRLMPWLRNAAPGTTKRRQVSGLIKKKRTIYLKPMKCSLIVDRRDASNFMNLCEECGGIIVPWLAKEITDSKFLRGIETTNGCVSMAGLDNICEALNALAKKGVVLSESRRSLYVDCATADLRRRRVQFIRPAI